MNICICVIHQWHVELFWEKLMIFSLLLSWGCIPYGICSVPLMVLCTSRILHVVPMMRGHLAYYAWLFLYQVVLKVCVWNQIIQNCGCRLIGGEDFLIVWENLDWLLLSVIVYPTTEDEILYLRCKVPRWSGFERLNFSLWIVLLCDYLEELTDTWCSWYSLSSLNI